MLKTIKQSTMQIVIDAKLHAQNGSQHIIQYPELNGMVFHSESERENWKRKTVEDMYHEKDENVDGMHKADFIFRFVELPEGVETLPPDWKIDPIPVTKPIAKVRQQPVLLELLDVAEYPWQKPKMH